jgi:hypothetical protein
LPTYCREGCLETCIEESLESDKKLALAEFALRGVETVAAVATVLTSNCRDYELKNFGVTDVVIGIGCVERLVATTTNIKGNMNALCSELKSGTLTYE